MSKKLVIALGGNAIQNKGEKGTFEEMYQNVYKTMVNLVELIKNPEYEIIVSHGNGPQVGTIMLQNAAAKAQVPEMPMFACGLFTARRKVKQRRRKQVSRSKKMLAEVIAA
jgi:carbamate kinase